MNKFTKLSLAVFASLSINTYTLVAQITLPISFESPGVTYTMVDFDGGTTSLVNNPSPGGINNSSTVLKMVKNAGQIWGGSKLTLSSPIDFTTNNTFKMKVYSPRANCPVLFKIEGPGGVSVEHTAYTTSINTWEELSWDFSGTASNTYTDLVFIYDLGVMGDGSNNFTFYQDDIQLVNQAPTLTQINLPVSFDATTVDYTLTDFGGNVSLVAPDPLDASNKVAITTKTNTAQLWAGTTIGTNLGFLNAIPFTATNHKMQVRVYSPDANIPVRLKAEVHGQPTQSVETEALTTVANAWETLVFDFDNQAPGTAAFNSALAYDMASIFFNFGTDGATAGTKVYMFDDVAIYTPTTPVLTQINLPVTFDATTVDYTVTDFGGNATVLGADPTNASNTVAITTKTNTAQLWAGTTIGTNLGFLNAIPFTATNHKMQVRVYSPDANIPVRLKAEVHGQPTQSVETEAMTTVANAWETLVFDFDNQAPGTAAFNSALAYDMASIFFNFGTDGATAGTKVYMFDDVAIYTPTTPVLTQINLPVTFDATTVDYTVTDFGGNATVLGADPTNASNTVAITTKTNTAQLWAGTTIGTNLGFLNAIPFTATNHKMQVRVYSPDANIPVRLKAEVHGQPTQSVETEALTTVANAWETLVFDFDNQAPGTAAFNSAFAYDMASIFFNFGTDGATAGTKVYMFDDVAIYTPTTPVLTQINLPVTFDATTVDYTVTDFGGNATVLGADPTNASNTVAITTKTNTAQLWAGTTIGTNLGFLNAIPFTATNHKMQVRVYSPDANIPVRLKVEVHGQPTQSVETEAMTTVANAWETLVFDFDNQAPGTAAFNSALAYDMASIFFNFGTDGATAGTKVYMFDDVAIYTPTTPVLTQINLPVTFDATTVDYTITDFGGNATVLGADPTNASNTVAITTKTNTAQLWAGTTIGTNLGFLNAIPFTATNHKMQVSVYSPDANIPVRLKVEVHGQPTQSVETEAMTTVANAWETLVFDFDNQAPGTAAFNSALAYDMASIFFNFGTDGATAGTKVYMFDDVAIYTPTTPVLTQINLPVTFDATTVDYTVTDFGGNATVLGADPTNASNTVAITTKTSSAQLWAGTTIGTNLGFLNAIPFTATNHKMQVRVYSPDANIPVRLKVEVHGQPTQSVETEAMTTVANAWETLVFDFDNQAPGTAAFNSALAYDMASIFFNFGTDGATAGTKVYMFDDVVIYNGTVEVGAITTQGITIYPNPATSTLHVSLNNATNYTITDLTGRLVSSGKLQNKSIDVEVLNKGIYILQVSTDKGLVSSRFTKQ